MHQRTSTTDHEQHQVLRAQRPPPLAGCLAACGWLTTDLAVTSGCPVVSGCRTCCRIRGKSEGWHRHAAHCSWHGHQQMEHQTDEQHVKNTTQQYNLTPSGTAQAARPSALLQPAQPAGHWACWPGAGNQPTTHMSILDRPLHIHCYSLPTYILRYTMLQLNKIRLGMTA